MENSKLLVRNSAALTLKVGVDFWLKWDFLGDTNIDCSKSLDWFAPRLCCMVVGHYRITIIITIIINYYWNYWNYSYRQHFASFVQSMMVTPRKFYLGQKSVSNVKVKAAEFLTKKVWSSPWQSWSSCVTCQESVGKTIRQPSGNYQICLQAW